MAGSVLPSTMDTLSCSGPTGQPEASEGFPVDGVLFDPPGVFSLYEADPGL